MSYKLTAQFASGLSRFQVPPSSYPLMRLAHRVVRVAALVACYAGVFVAVLLVESLPIQMLRWAVRPNQALYWPLGAIILILLLGAAATLTLGLCRHLRAKQVSIDLLIALLGSITALWYATTALLHT